MLSKAKSVFGGKRTIISLLLATFIFIPSLSLAATAVQVEYPESPDPIFEITNMSPGQTFNRFITATNNATTNQLFKFSVSPVGDVGTLAPQLAISVINTKTNVTKFEGSLAELYSVDEVNLDVLAPGVPTIYDFVATMNAAAGNTYMGLTEKFDMVVGFDATPTSQRATTGGTSAPAGLLTSLATSLGFASADSGAAIAGAQTGETPAVKGAEDAVVKGSGDVACPWWWIAALVLAVVLSFLGGVIRALEPEKFLRKYYYIWPPVLAAIAWTSHYYLHSNLQATWFCSNYWLVVLLLTVLGESAFVWIVRGKD